MYQNNFQPEVVLKLEKSHAINSRRTTLESTNDYSQLPIIRTPVNRKPPTTQNSGRNSACSRLLGNTIDRGSETGHRRPLRRLWIIVLYEWRHILRRSFFDWNSDCGNNCEYEFILRDINQIGFSSISMLQNRWLCVVSIPARRSDSEWLSVNFSHIPVSNFLEELYTPDNSELGIALSDELCKGMLGTSKPANLQP